MNIHEEGEEYPSHQEQRDIRNDPQFRAAVHNFGLDPDTVRLTSQYDPRTKDPVVEIAPKRAGAQAKTIMEIVLDAAKQCVVNDRQKNYGTPESNFETIAAYWNTYLKSIGFNLATSAKVGDYIYGLSATDVAVMMSLMKHSRLATSPNHRDSWIDIAGYAACGAECACKGQGIPE